MKRERERKGRETLLVTFHVTEMAVSGLDPRSLKLQLGLYDAAYGLASLSAASPGTSVGELDQKESRWDSNRCSNTGYLWTRQHFNLLCPHEAPGMALQCQGGFNFLMFCVWILLAWDEHFRKRGEHLGKLLDEN